MLFDKLSEIRDLLKKWWLVLIAGILSILLAAVLSVFPGTGFTTARIILSIDFIQCGLIAVYTVIKYRDYISGWGWTLAGAVLILALAITIAMKPQLADTIIVYAFTFGMIAKGISGIVNSINLSKFGISGWGWALFFSIITTLLGFALFVRPITAALSIDSIIGIAVLFSGIELVIIAMRMAKANSEVNKLEEKAEKNQEEFEKLVNEKKAEYQAAFEVAQEKLEGKKEAIEEARARLEERK